MPCFLDRLKRAIAGFTRTPWIRIEKVTNTEPAGEVSHPGGCLAPQQAEGALAGRDKTGVVDKVALYLPARSVDNAASIEVNTVKPQREPFRA